MSYFGSIGGTNQVLAPLGIDLERQGLGIFGDFVDTKNRVRSFRELGLSESQAQEFAALSKPGEFNVRSPAGSNNQIPPKQRFLFQVQFIVNPRVMSEVNSFVSDSVLRKFGFFIRQIDRPKVEYAYEDVNMYNVRTRVLTKIAHSPLNMSLWDDSRNTVGQFVNLYRRAHTPSARQNEYTNSPETSGFNFSKGILNPLARDYSTRTALPNNAKTFLNEIIIKQIYSTHRPAGGRAFAMTVYKFFNPVIKNFDFDDVNQETSESNGITMTIDYDSLFIEDFEVANIIPDTDLPDYYHFAAGKSITDNLLSLSATNAANGNLQIPKSGLNLWDEARRALTSGNPISYIKERAGGILRNGDPNLDFKGIRGYTSDVIGAATGGISGTPNAAKKEIYYGGD